MRPAEIWVLVSILLQLGVALSMLAVPRIAVPFTEQKQEFQFSQDGISNYSVFLVHESSKTLYVGAKDYILAFSLESMKKTPKLIEWSVPKLQQQSCIQKGKKEMECHNFIRILEFHSDNQLYACGTYAFDPQCIYISVKDFHIFMNNQTGDDWMESGRGKCPFDPTQQYTAVMADGILYAATVNNFLGTEPIISRATGNSDSRIRSETTVVWLSDPDFVGSAFVKESQNSEIGDDDKIYFFFTETAREYEFYQKVKVPRVARVCKGDMGGLKTLQRRWTSFVKTQLICADPESGIHFNIIKDIFTLQPDPNDWSTTVFYGIFMSQWERDEVSAVCSYSIQDIQDALNGKFKEYKRECEKWTSMTGVIPEPRPGSCITKHMKQTSYSTSLDLPDRVLNFIRDHPLMDQHVHPVDKKPLLVKPGTKYQKLAVSREAAVSRSGKHYDVLFLGTDQGHIHKAVKIGSQALILEDIALFEEEQPVENLQLYQGSLYVASPSRVVQFPIANCSRFRRCHDCILARDPLCGWDRMHSKCTNQHANESLLQDITTGNNSYMCPPEDDSPDTQQITAMTGARIVLSCSPPSAWSFCNWSKPIESSCYMQRSDGLEFTVKDDTLGKYVCHCQENKVTWRVASYSVEMDSGHSALSHSDRSYTVAVGFILFIVGAVLGIIVTYCYTKKKLSVHNTETQQEKKRHLSQIATTSSSPESPGSPADEQCPLAAVKKNGMINGYSGVFVGPEIVNNRVYLNSPYTDSGAYENSQDIRMHKINRDAPIAECEESSI